MANKSGGADPSWSQLGLIGSTPTEGFKKIEDQANLLIDEFREHSKIVRAGLERDHAGYLLSEGGFNERKVFEGWCIQKLASLQLLVIDYEKQINELMYKVDLLSRKNTSG